MVEKIKNRLDLAITNLNSDNIEVLFPLILDDLKYILVDYKKDSEKLTNVEEFTNSTDFREKITRYFALLATKYFKLIHNLDITIENTDDFSMAIAGGGYNSADNKIYYSDFGVLLSSKSDLSFLHTCLHEGRHKIQHKSYENPNVFEVEPHMLRLLKETLLEDNTTENNRKFYMDNYSMFFSENDAEIFARSEINSFLQNLLTAYQTAISKSSSKVDKMAIIKTEYLKYVFRIILKKETFNIDDSIEKSLFDSNLITDSYIVDGEPKDRLIAMDKHLKSHPELQEKYPILRLLFNGNTPKTYEEIIEDKNINRQGKTKEEQRNIDRIYNEIIVLDPILYLTHLLEQNSSSEITDYLNTHPTIITMYPEEIQSLCEKYDSLNTILNNKNK